VHHLPGDRLCTGEVDIRLFDFATILSICERIRTSWANSRAGSLRNKQTKGGGSQRVGDACLRCAAVLVDWRDYRIGDAAFIIFLIWIAVADAIYVANFGYAPPVLVSQFVHDVLTTRAGWNLISVGNGVGLLLAVVVFTISVVSFPLLLDRDVGAAVALLTSIRVVLKNPGTITMWGLVVATLLLIGSLPLFLGLTVTIPILGHATWHLYRTVVVFEPRSTPRPKSAHSQKAGAMPRIFRRCFSRGRDRSLYIEPQMIAIAKREGNGNADFQFSPCHRKHNLPDQLRVRLSSDRNEIA
jgi:hypothetical protein